MQTICKPKPEKLTQKRFQRILQDRLSAMDRLEVWQAMDRQGLRDCFMMFVDRVVCDFDSKTVTVILKTGLSPV